jgi:MSHA biogenesis protein MshN
LDDALITLEKGLAYAANDGAYQGFMAALLQRAERHAEAIVHFQVAMQHGAETPALWVGLAVSLQAEGRAQEAIQAYQQAKTGLADGDLKNFVAQKLKQLTQSIQAQR